ncbi:unnamed protein product [Mytilus edulis]|uniref:B box-type domain-containing protein n=1 Tax=Mytilus edulis TaxID=6550 RepID=A0A8S3T9G4_MYTED|nr:unnamed protein product [Mytilus edulis]
MATSGISTSIRKAKVPLSCYFCKGPDIKWKCDDCGVHMCNSCKVTVHQGPPSKQDNDVVSKQNINKTSPGFQEVTSVVIASVCNSYTQLLYQLDYKRKVTLEFDKEGNKLFSYANRIRTDSRNVVYVIDRFDNANHGRVVAVDINGRLKFTYDGPKDLGTFQPEGITITPSDNIVVADYYNKALHVINSKGDLLGLQFIFKDLDINYPSSVCFDTEGYLLIGCCRGENEEFGKIHVVKILDSLM